MMEKFRMLCTIFLVLGCFIAITYAVTVVIINPTDLSIIGVTVPPYTTSGGQVPLTATVKNAGSGYSFDSNFYLSENRIFDPSDSYLWGENTSALTLGKTQITKPDLVITGVTVPLYTVSGGQVPLTATVKNVGSGYSFDSCTYFYLSKNRILDPSDSYLGNEYTSPLSPGSSQTVSYSASIPSGSSGAYYILAKADGSNGISEEDEGNNIDFSKALETFVISPRNTSHAGIALSFDDGKYIDDWYAIRLILQKYNAHATFFISNLDDVNQSDIEKLRILQAEGNEIAFHGRYHLKAEEFLQTHSVDQYMDHEIIPGIDLMKSWGFNPVNFAYPYGSADPAANQALFGYFGHVRGIHNNNWNDDVYYTYGSNTPFIVSMGIDFNYGNSDESIYAGILKAKVNDKILLIYGHKPVPNNPGQYETSYDRLEKILQYVSDNNMKTYTISEMD